MSEKVIKDAIAGGTMRCPKCKKSIQKYEKYSETIDAVRDGFNVVEVDSRSSRVTLTCGNGDCDWRERTEYWSELLD